MTHRGCAFGAGQLQAGVFFHDPFESASLLWHTANEENVVFAFPVEGLKPPEALHWFAR